ncbi:MAG: hypothetical protein EBY40_03950 [Marivivens sp.]|nr:hypothetical protein [Marivivens sp.]NBT50555.1 hypothetical protein [Marivivens sp.]NCW68521.1 hypothetical protein [Marivivens sp.]NDH02266.1 hypothetical protein [Marivivens sp.]
MPTKKEALASFVDGKTRDYIDACFAEDSARDIKKACSDLAKAVKEIQSLKDDLNQFKAEFETHVSSQPDDKYSLSRRKLVRLVQKMGVE